MILRLPRVTRIIHEKIQARRNGIVIAPQADKHTQQASAHRVVFRVVTQSVDVGGLQPGINVSGQ